MKKRLLGLLFVACFVAGGLLLPVLGQESLEMPLDDIEDVGSDAELLSEQLDGLEEGDDEKFKIVTDDDITAVAVGDIYKSNQSAFKVTKIKKQSAEGGKLIMTRIRGKMDPGMKWSRLSGEGPHTMGSRETLLSRFMGGGGVMYVIAMLLLVMLIVSIRCGMYYRIDVHCNPSFVDQCRQMIAGGDLAGFEDVSVKEEGLLAQTCRVIAAGVKRLKPEEIKSRVEAEAIHEMGRISFPLKILNFVAVAAPLLGLLGTVMGMITCFDSLSGESATQSKSMAMAGGIKQALLTTAFGLIVALPSLLSYFVYSYRIGQISNLCAVIAEDLLHDIAAVQRSAEGETTA